MEENKNFTISVYTENNIGILNRLSAIFLKRHINIESMTVSKSEIDHVHRFTFVVIVSETLIRKVVLQLKKQIEVIGAFYHTEDEIIYNETALFKISYYCVYQAMLIKDNDPESDLSNLEAALKLWQNLCHFSLEML